MIQSHVGHLVYHISPANAAFYGDLLKFLGWQMIYEGEGACGLAGPNDASLWFMPKLKEHANDYDGEGLNHLAFGVPNQADVDTAVAYLAQHGIPALFETPRHRPDFSSPGNTYYQVMFESPDHILFEIVYTGPLA